MGHISSDVNLQEDNINTTKKNAEDLSDADKEVGPDENRGN
jgi:hypothetical protein